jgi:hypothetical protein
MKRCRIIAIALLASMVFPATAQQLAFFSHADTLHKTLMFRPAELSVSAPSLALPVPQNFYSRNLSFFCRQELHMQQAHIPVTFRLGSMDQCNRLEQKPGYR